MDWISDHLTAVFLGLAIVLGVAELASMDLILLMLAAGALAGMVQRHRRGAVRRARPSSPPGVATACLALVRPSLVKRLHSGPDLQLGHGKLVGAQGVVTEKITGLDSGRIKLGGRDLDRRAVRRHDRHRAGRDRRGAGDQGRHRLRPPGPAPRVLTRSASGNRYDVVVRLVVHNHE